MILVIILDILIIKKNIKKNVYLFVDLIEPL